MKYASHEYAEVLPLIQGEAFDKLVADIKTNGLNHAIVLFEGKVLDGRNRVLACEAAGVDPRYEELPAGKDPIDFVISANIHRRHLEPGQLEAFAVELANLKRGDNRFTLDRPSGPSTEQEGPKRISQAEAAKKLNVSHRNVKRLASVKKQDPAVFEEVKQGKLTTGAAEKKVKQSRATPSKGKSVPRAVDAPLEYKGTPAKDLTAQLEPCFKALWQLSVDLKKAEIRDWADKIERALEKKGIVPASERQRDAKGYLARIKPKADKPDAEPKPATDINGQVDEIVSRILIEDEEFRRLLEALDPEQAVEGDLKTDDHMAALKIREAAIRNGISPLATEQLATIRKALNLVMRRYGICRKERRDEARQAAPAAIPAA